MSYELSLGGSSKETLDEIERFFRKGEEYLRKRHQEGLAGWEFGQTRSNLVDQVIRRLFRFAAISQGERGGDSGFALLAMGGYGREEMNPCSDVDLLILHLPGKGKGLEEWLRAVLHPLWDWGLTVGYTVQTPKESWRVLQKDLDLWLSLLEGRFVAGEKGTFLLWEEEFSRSLSAENGKKIIQQIHERALARHGRTGDSVFVLEPEIKEGKGGLRDYHAALWASRIQYGVHSARELTEKKLLSEKEWKRYSQALSFLFRVRNQLHYLHGRREDRLSFEDQGAVAQAFGASGEDFQRATEAFLKDYFTHALQVYRISWNLLEKCLDERAVTATGEALENTAEFSSGLALYHGKLIGTDPFRFQRNPFFLWQAFQAIHQHGLEMDSQLKEAITENMDLVNERFREAPQSIQAFNSFFRQQGDLYRALEAMHETGFLRKFLPEFDRVYCHVQYDRYHIYPVDVHSFYTIRELETLMREKAGAPSPILGQLIREIKDPGILKLAALIHDLGKGEGSSHALRGEKIASSIGQRLKLPSLAQDILCFLVREHLTFVEIAQRRDLADENLIFRFAQTVGDSERLKMLYLLCYADLRAVGPSSWTVWKDTLMRELFLKSLHLLEKDEGLRKEAQDQRVNTQNEIMDLLRGQIPLPRIAEYLVNIPSRHYAVHEARAIAQQILMAERLNLEKVVLEGEKKPEEGGDEIVVVAQDAPGLFANISGVLTINYLNILSAQISTWENGTAVDLFRVQNMIDEDLFQPRRWNKLQEDLKKVLGGQMEVNSLVEGVAFPLFHPAVPSRRPTRVEIDNVASDFYTVIDVFTQDCPGLLYRITRKIFELGLNIWMSRISTKVDQVADAFYVQDLSGAKLEDKEIIGTIQRELIAELEKE